MGAKRDLETRRNENRRLRRQAQALLKKKLAQSHAKMKILESQRERKAKERLTKFRASIKQRFVFLDI